MIFAGNRIVMTGSWPVAGRPGFLLALPMVYVLHNPACRSKRRDRMVASFRSRLDHSTGLDRRHDPHNSYHKNPVRHSAFAGAFTSHGERNDWRVTEVTRPGSGHKAGKSGPRRRWRADEGLTQATEETNG
jgi:hypothetical protein